MKKLTILRPGMLTTIQEDPLLLLAVPAMLGAELVAGPWNTMLDELRQSREAQAERERRAKIVKWLKEEANSLEARMANLTAKLTQAGIDSLTAA